MSSKPVRRLKIVTALDQNIGHELAVLDQLNSPARVRHVDEMRSNAYQLVENVGVIASELRHLLDRLDGPAPKVNTRGLVGRLRTAEVEMEAAVGH